MYPLPIVLLECVAKTGLSNICPLDTYRNKLKKLITYIDIIKDNKGYLYTYTYLRIVKLFDRLENYLIKFIRYV